MIALTAVMAIMAHTARRAAAAAFAAALLAGCATPASIRPGMTAAEVAGRVGQPAARHALPGGAQRLEYPEGGLQQQTWMIDIDAAGRVTAAHQVKSLENFGRLRPGIDRQEDVLREFGQPWRIEHYRFSGLTAWLYPHLELGVWQSMMAVHFDAQGRVERVQNGPDPRFLGGGNRE